MKGPLVLELLSHSDSGPEHRRPLLSDFQKNQGFVVSGGIAGDPKRLIPHLPRLFIPTSLCGYNFLPEPHQEASRTHRTGSYGAVGMSVANVWAGGDVRRSR
jgi:hypothetical protein